MTKTKIKPLGNRLLVKRSQAEKSKGGILLPDSAQEKPKQGTIIKVGPGKMNEKGEVQKLHVKEGDCILFSSYAGTEVKCQDTEEDFLILSEDDVLGILS